MGHEVECPQCENAFFVHYGQNVAHCYTCGTYFNAHTNVAYDE